MKYYVMKNGHKFDEEQIKDIFFLVSGASTYTNFDFWYEDCIKSGVFRIVEPETVIDFLKLNMFAKAVLEYKKTHDCDLVSAKNMVEKIREDMKKYKGGKQE